MTVLTREFYGHTGSDYVAFLMTNGPFKFEPSREESSEYIFFEISEDLLDLYRNISMTDLTFSCYDFIQFSNAKDIYRITQSLILMQYHLVRVDESMLKSYKTYFIHSKLNNETYHPEDFKMDLIETLHFLIEKIHQIITSQKWLVISGF